MAATVGSRRERTTAAKVSRQQYEQLGKPSEDDIRILAYNFYERRRADGIAGDAASDWIEAERQLYSADRSDTAAK
ncbi:MAG TPA: hypothetical protein VIM81_20950 [Gammaproteobacteria bacterium]